MFNIDGKWLNQDEAFHCLAVKYRHNFTADSAIAVLYALRGTSAFRSL